MPQEWVGLVPVGGHPSTKPVPEPLAGDCTLLPDIPAELGTEGQELGAIQVLGSAAKIARKWVGVCIRDVAANTGHRFANALTHPVVWIAVFSSHEVNRSFQAAQQRGLCTIGDDGYAYPTQRLADRLMGQVIARAHHDLNGVHTLNISGWSGDVTVEAQPVGEHGVTILAPKRDPEEHWTFPRTQDGVLSCFTSLLGSPGLLLKATTHPLIIRVPEARLAGLAILVDKRPYRHYQ